MSATQPQPKGTQQLSTIARIKRHVERLPEPVGRLLVGVPFTMRLGLAYLRTTSTIARVERSSRPEVEAAVLKCLRATLWHAAERVDFYRTLYRTRGFDPRSLQSLDDWRHVPVVTKEDLQSVPFESRCARRASGMRVNTGGTSGQPLEFMLDRRAFAREWAHMHYIWRARGYDPRHLKLTFRGKHFPLSEVMRFNPVHNEYVVNASAPMEQVVDRVLALPLDRPVRWLHGYPSLVAEFGNAMAASTRRDVSGFRSHLFGALLGSEYPAPQYRTRIESVLTTNVVSWYGHSEMALLARETAHGLYESMPTYGFAEAVPDAEDGTTRLVCTSFHNTAHPFIRYDTGDRVDPVAQSGGSLAFRIAEGRVGDFVHDRTGRRHSLTAIIFGRHHAAFERLKHLQVREDAPGYLTLLLTPREPVDDPKRLRAGFDLGDLDIDWRIEVVGEPVRTALGKVRLKVPVQQSEGDPS